MSHTPSTCPTCGGTNCRRASCSEEAGIRGSHREPPHDPYAYLRERERQNKPEPVKPEKREAKQLSLDSLVLASGPIEDILNRIERQLGCGLCGYAHDECFCVGNRDGNDVVWIPEEASL